MPLSADVARHVISELSFSARPSHSLERRRLQCYLALIVVDLAALLFGFTAAGYFYIGIAGATQSFVLAQLVAPLFLTVGLYNEAYSMRALLHAGQGFGRALLALSISALAVIFVAFYTKSSEDFSRVSFTLGVLLSIFALAWSRAQMRSFIRWRCGKSVVNELIIMDGGPQVELPGARHIDASALGLQPNLDDPHTLDRIGLALANADRVIISCAPPRRAAWAMILKGANIAGEVIDDAVADLGAMGARVAGGHGWLTVSTGPLGLRMRVVKRLFDLATASLALVLLSPVLLIVALAIRLEDGGPVLFVQRRVGRSNRFFAMIKFRSMSVSDSDHDGTMSTVRGDQRITRIGKFIRRTSIDELPQLFNVIHGDMSLVGPRPHALGSQAGDKLFWEVDVRYLQRHALKPGLTGLAQIRGLRGATDEEADLSRRLGADLEYLAGWSLWRDIAILFATVKVLTHDRAY